MRLFLRVDVWRTVLTFMVMKPLDREHPTLARWVGEFAKAPDVRAWSANDRLAVSEDLRWLVQTYRNRSGPGIRLWKRSVEPLSVRELTKIQCAVRVGWSSLMESGRLRHPLEALVKRTVGWQLPPMRARLVWGLGKSDLTRPLRVIYEAHDKPSDIIAAIGEALISLQPRLCACGCGEIAANGSKYARKQCGQNARFRRHYAATRRA